MSDQEPSRGTGTQVSNFSGKIELEMGVPPNCHLVCHSHCQRLDAAWFAAMAGKLEFLSANLGGMLIIGPVEWVPSNARKTHDPCT